MVYPVGRRNGKGQATASPLRRIFMARGLNMMEVAVHSGVSITSLRKLDRLEPKNMAKLQLRTILLVAQYFQVKPTDLLPFLDVVPKKRSSPTTER